MPRTPWIALAAVISMFVIPYLPAWLFEGPRTVKHRPRRHVCADCNAPWTAAHMCMTAIDIRRPLRGELRRLHPPVDPGPTPPVQSLPARRGVRPGQLIRRRGARKGSSRSVPPYRLD
jgi:hypothetical protein